MTIYKSGLANFRKKSFTVQLELGDDASYEIEGIGSTYFQLDSGSIIHIDEILYVLGLEKNFLSVAVLEDKGYKVTFMDGKALLYPKGQLSSSEVTEFEKDYKVPRHSMQVLVHDTVNSSELWHRRFVHLHFKALPNLQKMVSEMPAIHFDQNEVCKGCLLGKNVKKSFPSSNKRSKEVIELVHFDIYGPMSSTSLSGCLYYVIFINDFLNPNFIAECLEFTQSEPSSII